jgi:pimeloyl-ACP methyl ester carboxylesterase
VCPPHLQRELAERCPTAEWGTVEDGGHMLPLERPAEVAAALRDWMLRCGLARSQ